MQPDGIENIDEMHEYGIDRYVSICLIGERDRRSFFRRRAAWLIRESAKSVSVEPMPIASTVRAINSSTRPCPASEPSRSFRRAVRHEQPVAAGHCRHVLGATANEGVVDRRRDAQCPVRAGVFVTWNWPLPMTEA